tara:strand:+ start:458 stop:1018 length:561 start_codon:yes stop_codon:yes gene_type:complete
MTWLIVGLIFFFGAHLQKRLIPSLRQRLVDRLGEKGFKGIIALISAVGLTLIVLGFRQGGFIPLYDLGSSGLLLNNLAMMLAVAFLGLGHSKSRLRKYVRHPMLLSVIFWSIGHLLVNGDLKSVILFLSFGLWSFLEIRLTNSSTPSVQSFTKGSLKGDIGLVVIATLAYFTISVVHLYLGVFPFY